jgi:hypothetical protein
MGKTVLMIGLHRAVHEADVVRDQFQIATDGLADTGQTGKVPVDREALQNDGIRPECFPETGAPGRVHLGKNPNSHLELGETAFDQFQKKRGGDGDPTHAQFSQLGQQGHHPFLPWACPFAVAETGAVEEIIEGNAMMIEPPDVVPQICFREWCRQVAGTAAADAVGGELAVNFIDRVGGERRNQFWIVVRRQRELERSGRGMNGGLIGTGCFHNISS